MCDIDDHYYLFGITCWSYTQLQSSKKIPDFVPIRIDAGLKRKGSDPAYWFDLDFSFVFLFAHFIFYKLVKK